MWSVAGQPSTKLSRDFAQASDVVLRRGYKVAHAPRSVIVFLFFVSFFFLFCFSCVVFMFCPRWSNAIFCCIVVCDLINRHYVILACDDMCCYHP